MAENIPRSRNTRFGCEHDEPLRVGVLESAGVRVAERYSVDVQHPRVSIPEPLEPRYELRWKRDGPNFADLRDAQSEVFVFDVGPVDVWNLRAPRACVQLEQ